MDEETDKKLFKVSEAVKEIKPFLPHLSEDQLRNYLYSGMRRGVVKSVSVKNPITKTESKLIPEDEIERIKIELK